MLLLLRVRKNPTADPDGYRATRLREARRTGKLDLSSLGLETIPPEVLK